MPGGSALGGDSGQDCLESREFVVEDIRVRKGRGTVSTVRLADPAGGGLTVRFGSPDPLPERLRTGAVVTAELWRGEVVSVSRQGATQETTGHPLGGGAMVAGLGLLFAMTGALALYASWWWLMRPGACVRASPPALAAVGLAVLWMGVGTVPVMCVLYAADAPGLLVPVLWTVAAVPSAVAAVRRARRGNTAASPS
ncbi:hypothetical protein F0L17_25820 [Streptomyces sp. TRM43335]|uniref:Uncharacterized protein n=1 Tax=Streptomyces taklimakanensis TaxID=2569853 RepID=A0A6G2BK14_9ACTN|nr:hypothetical protein [Streptomyces taklimakanensis]MTE22456.1 hypothetical protein [Streptomyces taklimakanensis]